MLVVCCCVCFFLSLFSIKKACNKCIKSGIEWPVIVVADVIVTNMHLYIMAHSMWMFFFFFFQNSTHYHLIKIHIKAYLLSLSSYILSFPSQYISFLFLCYSMDGWFFFYSFLLFFFKVTNSHSLIAFVLFAHFIHILFDNDLRKWTERLTDLKCAFCCARHQQITVLTVHSFK